MPIILEGSHETMVIRYGCLATHFWLVFIVGVKLLFLPVCVICGNTLSALRLALSAW